MYLAYKTIEHGRKWFNKSPVWKHWFSGQIYGYNQILSAIEYNQILSLSSLGKNGNEVEKENIRHNCKKFIVDNLTYSPVFLSLSEENKIKILDSLYGGKGVILYKKIKTWEDLDIIPEGEFFSKTEFYSLLKNEIMGDEDYENVKRFCQTMHLKKLSEPYDIYNFQDTTILCKIFENRAREMTRRFL